MRTVPRTPSAEELTLLAQVISDVTRLHRVLPQDAQDFAQCVQVKMLERNYDVFYRFAGRSSLRTYLTVVVVRLLLDWRNSVYGKYRPSAAALREGVHAVCLERLMRRDGHTLDEAIEIMRASGDAPPVRDLERLAARLPHRIPRRMVSYDEIEDVPAIGMEDPIEAEERRIRERRRRRRLAMALRELTGEDRHLIRMRYGRDCSVQSLAKTLGTDPKRLYRRFENTLLRLRRTMTSREDTSELRIV